MLWHCFRTAVTGAVYSMKNINMIGGGLVSSQTTASLIYDYERKIIWFTEGRTLRCKSLNHLISMCLPPLKTKKFSSGKG